MRHAIANGLILGLLSGCGPNAPSLDERYRAAADRGTVWLAASTVPAGEAEAALQELTELATHAKGTLVGAQSRVLAGRLLDVLGQRAQARETWEPLCRESYEFREECLMSRIYIARSHEAERDWEAAERVYDGMGQYHLGAPLWFDAPMYAAEMYGRHGDAQRQRHAYEHAVKVYRERLNMSWSLEQRGHLQHRLAMAYQGAGQFDQAAELLEYLARLDDGVPRPEVLIALARLYEQQHQPARAAVVVEELRRKYLNDPVAQGFLAERS